MSTPSTPSTPRPWRKRILIASLVTLGAGAVLVALAPTIASTSPVRNFALGKINEKIPGKLDIADWNFSWLSEDSLSGIAYTDDAGHLMTVEEVRIKRLTLLKAVFGGRIVEVDVTKIRGELPTVIKPKGAPAAEPAAEPAASPQAKSNEPVKIPQAGLVLLVKDVDVLAKIEGQKPVRITADNFFTLDAADLNHITASSGIKVAQEGGAEGLIALKAEITKLLAADRALAPDAAQADVHLDVTGLPIAALDAAVGMATKGAQSGWMLAAFDAKTLAAHVTATGGANDLKAEISADADQTRFLTLKLASDGKVLRATPSELLRFPVRQALLDKAAPGQATISDGAVLALDMRNLEIPVRPSVDPAALALDVSGGFTGAPLSLTWLGKKTEAGAPIGLHALSFSAATAKLADGFKAQFQATPFAGTHAGQVQGSAAFTKPLKDGKFNPATVAADFMSAPLDVDFSATHLPMTLADAFVAKGGVAATFLGDAFDKVSLTASLPAGVNKGEKEPWPTTTVSLKEFTTTQAKIHPFQAALSSSGSVLLKNDLSAELAITPKLAQAYGGYINPLLLLAQSGTSPVKFQVKGDTFRFDKKNQEATPPAGDATHADIRLDLGTLQLAYGGMLKQVGDVLANIPGFDAGIPKEAPSITVPPMDATLDKNVFSYHGFKTRCGKLDMAFKGGMGLADKRVNLTAQIPSESVLAMSPMLNGYLQPGQTLELPISGTVTNPSLDTKEFASALLKLAAQAGAKKLIEDKGTKLLEKEGGKLLEKSGSGALKGLFSK